MEQFQKKSATRQLTAALPVKYSNKIMRFVLEAFNHSVDVDAPLAKSMIVMIGKFNQLKVVYDKLYSVHGDSFYKGFSTFNTNKPLDVSERKDRANPLYKCYIATLQVHEQLSGAALKVMYANPKVMISDDVFQAVKKVPFAHQESVVATICKFSDSLMPSESAINQIATAMMNKLWIKKTLEDFWSTSTKERIPVEDLA